MSKNSFSTIKVKFKIQINNLITLYEQKAECGIFFKLNPQKTPLEILGVLDFLKDRIKKWGNTNFFSYYGDLFEKGIVLIVGARDLEEAISIIVYMYLTNILENEQELNNLIEKLDPSNNLEIFLRTQISKDVKKGYSKDPELELKLKRHLEDIVYNQEDKEL
jgi:hypothetical protein